VGEVDELGTEVLEALRGYVVAFQESGHDLAHHLGLPVTDGLALGAVLYAERVGTPLSPTGLGRRLAMTSGATTALVNRLEARGMVQRSREHEDRRVVTLRPTDEARARAEEFTGRASDVLVEAIAARSEHDLVVVRDFLREFTAILPRADRPG
jgi:DNA-binding MarR family transcriptional regulator